MKRLKIFIIALQIVRFCYATPQEDLFVQANELYKAGKFAQAQELYEKIPEKSSRVYYNLGNCFYKQNKYGHALANWRKAEHDWGFFNRSELLRNIMLVKKLSGAHPACPPKLSSEGWEGSKDMSALSEQNPAQKFMLAIKVFSASIVSFIRATPLLFLQILFLMLWFIIFLFLRFLYRKKQRIVIVTLFTLLVISGSMLAMKYGLNARRYGVILNKTSLLSGPGSAYQVLGELNTAQEVIIKKQSGDYCKVTVHNHLGWVACKDLEKI